jgi:hypothetical protein
MDRQTIEDKDRDVVKKFRTVVEGKELQRKKHKGRLKLLAGMAAVCFLGLWLFADFYSGWKPPAESGKAAETKNKITAGMNAAIPLPETGRQVSPSAQSGASEKYRPDSSKKISSNDLQPAVKSPQYLKNAKDIQEADLVRPEDKKIAAKSSQKKSVSDGVQIAKILACREVEDKQCAMSQELFSVKKDGKVYVWMDVRSKAIPHTLKHIYFVNGRRYRSIRLAVKYPQMRTWSGIALNGYQDVGKWRVDVVSEQGQTLSHIEFSVVP